MKKEEAEDFLKKVKQNEKKFFDLHFPSKNISISKEKLFLSKFQKIIWKKAPGKSFRSNKKIFIKQGYLGNCYFISALNSLSQKKNFLDSIIGPFDEEFGIYSFKFYKNEWIYVIVDEFIPYEDDLPIFCSTESDEDSWVYLMEKAYAKLHGSYHTLDGGTSVDSFIDLTGANASQYDIQTLKLNSEQISNCLKLIKKENWMINCSSSQKELNNGIPSDHAYSIVNYDINENIVEIYDSLCETDFKSKYPTINVGVIVIDIEGILFIQI